MYSNKFDMHSTCTIFAEISDLRYCSDKLTQFSGVHYSASKIRFLESNGIKSKVKFKSIGIILLGIIWACHSGRQSAEGDSGLEIVRFDRHLFALNHDSPDIQGMEARDRAFFRLYVEGVLQLGKADAPELPEFLSLFLQDSIILEVYDSVARKYPDMKLQEKELAAAFRHYADYFPEKALPVVYTYISGFNQSVVVDSNLIGISLDNYLGEDCIFYKMLATPIPRYIARRMTEREIVRDALYGWLSAEYPFHPRSLDLLSGIIYQGKIMYLLEKLLPGYEQERLFGYTPEQLEWCRNSEGSIWAFMVDNEYLFENQQMLFRKYLNEAPFSSGMPQESPGKAVVWCGYRIVREYVRKKDCTIQELMEEQDYHKILRGAAYRPS